MPVEALLLAQAVSQNPKTFPCPKDINECDVCGPHAEGLNLDGVGVIQFCPKKELPSWTWEALETARRAKIGILPRAGGFEDQPASMVLALEVLGYG